MGGPRLMATLKIAICIPCYGNPEAMFLQSLTQMISHFYEANLADENGDPYDKQIETLVVSSSMLTESRHRLAAEALNWGADYMLWADADHIFPPDALCRLWAHGKDIVGCNYARRCKPTAPTAVKGNAEDGTKALLYTTIDKAQAGDLEEVEHLGFGLCLMKMSVFDALQDHAERDGKASFLPLFMFQPTEDHRTMIGEDVFFFGKCRSAGLKVWCDHGLSWEVGHIAKNVITNAHAVVQKDRWDENRATLANKYAKRIEELEAAQ
jgi:hypothetical protein